MALARAARPPQAKSLAGWRLARPGLPHDAARPSASVRQVARILLLPLAAAFSLHSAFCPPSAVSDLLYGRRGSAPSSSREQRGSSGGAATGVARRAVVSDAPVDVRGARGSRSAEDLSDGEVMTTASEVIREKRGRHAWYCWLESNGVANTKYRPNRYGRNIPFLRDFLRAFELYAFQDEYEDFRYLVSKVLNVQAKDPRASKAWEFWSGRVEYGLEMNPEWHSPVSLRDFLAAYESKALMKEAQKVYELSEKILSLQQKAGPAVKEQWSMYLKRFTESGDKDKMCSGELNSFLKHYEEGYQLTSVASSLRRCMILSPDLWRAWRAYVGNTHVDAFESSQPYRYHESHTLNFLNHLAVNSSRVVESFKSEPVAMRTAQYHKLLARKVSVVLGDKHMKKAWRQFMSDRLPGRNWPVDPDPYAQSDKQLEAFLRKEASEMLDSQRDSLYLRVMRYQRKSKKQAQEWESFVADKTVDGQSDVKSDPFFHGRETLEEFLAERTA